MRYLCTLLSLLIPSLAIADEYIMRPCPWESVFYFAPKAYHEELKFRGNTLLTDVYGVDFNKSVDGVLFGFDTGLGCKSDCGFWGGFELSYTGGKLQRGGQPDRYVYDFDVEATVGFYLECARISIIPYGGIAYAFDKQNFNRPRFDEEHHLRLSYRTYYIPCGVLLNMVLNECVELGVNFKAMPQINSKMKINYGDRGLLDLGKRCGYRIEIPITCNSYYWNYQWKWMVIPFWERRDYGQSQALFADAPFLRIPAQVYTDIGVKIQAGILF